MPGASGSSTISVNALVPGGGAVHSSGGAQASSSSAVNIGSSASPSTKAALISRKPPTWSLSSPPSLAIARPACPARTLRSALPSQAGTCSSIVESPENDCRAWSRCAAPGQAVVSGDGCVVEGSLCPPVTHARSIGLALTKVTIIACLGKQSGTSGLDERKPSRAGSAKMAEVQDASHDHHMPVRQRIAWMAAIWLVSVGALALVSWAIGRLLTF